MIFTSLNMETSTLLLFVDINTYKNKVMMERREGGFIPLKMLIPITTPYSNEVRIWQICIKTVYSCKIAIHVMSCSPDARCMYFFFNFVPCSDPSHFGYFVRLFQSNSYLQSLWIKCASFFLHSAVDYDLCACVFFFFFLFCLF